MLYILSYIDYIFVIKNSYEGKSLILRNNLSLLLALHGKILRQRSSNTWSSSQGFKMTL